jgi:predicted transcriptional regulator
VAIVGVHTPEFDQERVAASVEKHVKQFGIEYPVVIDNNHKNWDRWNQQFWPAVYVVDKKGKIRWRWEGELNYNHAAGEQKIAQVIEKLLAEPE